MIGFDPQLFLTAQDREWTSVLKELERGQKTSHWMWFVFPQLKHLSRSPTAKQYGIVDLDQAAEYLGHPVLRDRLTEVCKLLLRHSDTPAETILGSVDALKLRSSLTLFSQVEGAPGELKRVLDEFFDEPCPLTMAAIAD